MNTCYVKKTTTETIIKFFDVYGVEYDDIHIPAGYKAVDFRPVKPNEFWLGIRLDTKGGSIVYTNQYPPPPGVIQLLHRNIESPRLILERVKKIKVRQWVITETGEPDTNKKAGDNFLATNSTSFRGGWIGLNYDGKIPCFPPANQVYHGCAVTVECREVEVDEPGANTGGCK